MMASALLRGQKRSGSFHNLPAIANHIIALNKDVEIICSGENGNFNSNSDRIRSLMYGLSDQSVISDD